MPRLHVELSLPLDRNKTPPRPLHRFGDRFRIQVVTLVGLHLRLHVLRRHQSHLAPLLAQSAPQKVRSTSTLYNF